jgi:hypothetical protein
MDNSQDDIWSWGSYPELGTGTVEFTVVPLEYGTFDAINPMGHMNLPQHPIPTSAGGFNFSANGYNKDVKAPADGLITAIRFTHVYGPDNMTSFPDYAVRIYHTNTFLTWYDHLSAIDEAILAKTGALQEGWNKTRVSVKAGDVFGKTAASPKQVVGLGMYAYDKEKTLNFINPEKYGPFGAHAVFAFDYFKEDIRRQLFTTYIKRNAEPRGGKIDFDEVGKLSGNWIVEGSDVIKSADSWNYWLAFVYDMYYPESRRISIGVELGKTINRLNGLLTQPVEGPEYTDVTASTGPAVYKLADAVEGMNSLPTSADIKYTLLAQVVAEHKIKVQLFEGNVGNPSFTDSAMYYTR